MSLDYLSRRSPSKHSPVSSHSWRGVLLRLLQSLRAPRKLSDPARLEPAAQSACKCASASVVLQMLVWFVVVLHGMIASRMRPLSEGKLQSARVVG